MSEYVYQGTELDVFQHAANWKRYYASRLRPHIQGDVLEVGAGIGGTSRFLCGRGVRTWTALEPDPSMAARLDAAFAREPLPVPTRAICGTLATLPAAERFDAILYIDVLEHIEEDRSETMRAFERLKPGGRLVILCPAHNWLYSPFDRAIGHYRRYSRRSLARVGPGNAKLIASFYLDAAGMFASLANRMLMQSESPTLAQIRFWDSRIIPVSRVVDPMLGYRVGKTVITVFGR